MEMKKLLIILLALLFLGCSKPQTQQVTQETFESKELHVKALSSETERPPDLDGVFAHDKIAEFDIKLLMCGGQQVYFLNETNLPKFFKLGYTNLYDSKMRIYVPNFVEDLATSMKN